MTKRFTFKDAKAKIAQLEAELVMLKDAAVADVKDDVKKIGFGDVAFFLGGALVGGLLVWIF